MCTDAPNRTHECYTCRDKTAHASIPTHALFESVEVVGGRFDLDGLMQDLVFHALGGILTTLALCLLLLSL